MLPSFLPPPVLAALSSFVFRLAPTPMLERLRIQNFKSWQDTGDMAFGSLTGFFGTNSSGKSSILQFLLMLKQTVESSDRSRVLHLGDDKSYVDLGTTYDILHNHTDPLTLTFTLAYRDSYYEYHLQYNSSLNYKSIIEFTAQISRSADNVQLLSFEYTKKDLIGDTNKAGIELLNADDDVSKSIYENYSIDSKKHQKQTVSPKDPIGKFYAFPRFAAHKSILLTTDFELELESLFIGTYYLGPLREYPSRLYIWAGEQTQSVGNRGERAVAALLSSRNQGPTIDMGEGQPKRTVEEHVAHWLKELGLIYSFKVQPIAPNRKEYEVRIQRTAESASVFLTDVGFGVSQILPVLVLLFYVPEGSTVILEQPEIHLHPAVQAGLADVFIDAIKRRKVQIILESHSEHLLQRLQRRIAEEMISQEDIKLYFTSIEEGRSKLTTLELDKYGNIGNWPKGFFGDAFAESAAKTKAEMKRKLRQQ